MLLKTSGNYLTLSMYNPKTGAVSSRRNIGKIANRRWGDFRGGIVRVLPLLDDTHAAFINIDGHLKMFIFNASPRGKIHGEIAVPLPANTNIQPVYHAGRIHVLRVLGGKIHIDRTGRISPSRGAK